MCLQYNLKKISQSYPSKRPQDINHPTKCCINQQQNYLRIRQPSIQSQQMNSQKKKKAAQVSQLFTYIPKRLKIKREYDRSFTAAGFSRQLRLLTPSITLQKERHCFSARITRNNSRQVKPVRELFGQLEQVSNAQQGIQEYMKQKINNLKSLINQRTTLNKMIPHKDNAYLIQKQQTRCIGSTVLHSKSSRRQLLQWKSAKQHSQGGAKQTSPLTVNLNHRPYDMNMSKYGFTKQIMLKGGKINSQNMHIARKNSIASDQKKAYSSRRMTNHSQLKKKASEIYNEEDCRPWETLRPEGLDYE